MHSTPDPDPPIASDPNGDGLLRISEVSRRTGVKPELLRAWETRYGIPEPRRSEGGLRLYSAADLAAVKLVQDQIDRGLAPAEAAAVAKQRRSGASAGPAPEPLEATTAPDGSALVELAAALDRFDDRGAHRILDRLFDAHGVPGVLQNVVLPYLRDLGERWEGGEVDIAQEHFACSLLRARMLSRARTWGQGEGSLAVLGCSSGEQHDLGLAIFALALHTWGWRIAYLGPDTPMEAFEFAVSRLHPQALVVSAVDGESLRSMRPALDRITEATDLWVGGHAAADAEGLPGLPLKGDPVEAAANMVNSYREDSSAGRAERHPRK